MIYEWIEKLAAFLGMSPQETAGYLLCAALFLILVAAIIIRWRRSNRYPQYY